MRVQSVAASMALTACTIFLPACSADDPDTDAAPRDTDTTSTSAPASDVAAALMGTYRTPTITVKQMSRAALRAGYDGYTAGDVDEFLTSEFGDARGVVFTLELTADRWVAFQSVDDGPAEDIWAGPYEVVDDSTVVAGTPPCGPVTYDYRIDGDELVLEMTDNACVEPGGAETPPGELVGQTTLYQSAPFERIS